MLRADQGADREAADSRRARRVTVRLLLWNLADSMTTVDELRAKLPELADGDRWISDPLGERFGLISSRERTSRSRTRVS